MGFQTISFKGPRPTAGGFPVSEGSDIPTMRPRTGKRASPQKLADLLADALEDLASSPCSFWACKGPRAPRPMCTCRKCWSMRAIATVHATLSAQIAPKAGA